jgi:hypothetical protein
MSVHDLIDRWEEGLAEALTGSREREPELPAKDLKVVAGVLIRSRLQAGWNTWDCCTAYTEAPWTFASC